MKIIKWILTFTIVLTNIPAFAQPQENELFPYTVYYSDKASVADLSKYKLLVLDTDYHPPLRALSDRGAMLLGYISLGEVEKHRNYFDEVKQDGILLQENKNWEGSYFVDVRSEKWVQRVISQIIPEILRKGFAGLFLDTLDNPGELERIDPKNNKDMVEAAVHLVKAIRLHYPKIKIMVNRGYELLPFIANDVDMLLGESMYADYDPVKKKNVYVKNDEYLEQVKILKDTKNINPNLGLYTLDYWDKQDKEGIAKIYIEQKKNGFIPYVASVSLDELFDTPDLK